MLRFWIVAAALLELVTPAVAQSPYTWNTTDGTWNTALNWLDNGNNPAVPTSSNTTALVFNASGTTSYAATNGIGAFTPNSMTFNNTGSGTISIAGAAANTLTFAGTAQRSRYLRDRSFSLHGLPAQHDHEDRRWHVYSRQ